MIIEISGIPLRMVGNKLKTPQNKRGVSGTKRTEQTTFFANSFVIFLSSSIQSKGQVGKPNNAIFPQSCYSFLSPDSCVTKSLLSPILFPAPPRSLTGNPLNSSFLSWVDFQLLVMASCYTSKSFFPSLCLFKEGNLRKQNPP